MKGRLSGQQSTSNAVPLKQSTSNVVILMYSTQAIKLITSKCCHSYSTQLPLRWPARLSQGHVLHNPHVSHSIKWCKEFTKSCQCDFEFLVAGNLRNHIKTPTAMSSRLSQGHVLQNPHISDSIAYAYAIGCKEFTRTHQ